MRAVAFKKTWETWFGQYFESVGVVAISVGHRAAISREDEATISSFHYDLAVDVKANAPGGISSDDDISTAGVSSECVSHRPRTKPNSISGVGTSQTASGAVRKAITVGIQTTCDVYVSTAGESSCTSTDSV